MARQRPLWDVIDADRRRWMRAGAIVALLVLLLVFSVWLLVTTRSGRAFDVIVRVVAPLAAILMFPLVRAQREIRARQALGAVPAATGAAPETKRALNEVALAAGLSPPPQLALYVSGVPNAFVTTENGVLCLSASTAFVELPTDEQRAGIAMLVGRSLVDVTSFAAEHQLTESTREDPVPPENDPVLFSAWLDAAVAGDNEGLRILREPAPMICLLERLGGMSTAVPEFAFSGGHDAVFGFLAWPYPQTWGEPDASLAGGQSLPSEAAAAVAAVIAEERSRTGIVGLSSGARVKALGNPQALRAARLREVSGAEGAVAGSTSARVPHAPSATASIGAAAVRIDVHCPSCGAGNAPSNTSCVACGKSLRVRP